MRTFELTSSNSTNPGYVKCFALEDQHPVLWFSPADQSLQKKLEKKKDSVSFKKREY